MPLKGEDLSSKTNYSKDKLEITIKKSFNLLTNFKILSYEVCIEEVQLLVRLCAFSSAQFMLQVVIAINSSVKRQKDKKMLILFIPMNVREIRTLCFLSGTQEL